MNLLDQHGFLTAVNAPDLETFLAHAFPPAWMPIAARILESGAELADNPVKWAPSWSLIPRTIRTGQTPQETALKSIFYRVHDALHQLWGVPHPVTYSDEEHHHFKRTLMCGEVAVLALTEFAFGEWVWNTYPDLRAYVDRRNAVPLLRGELHGKSIGQIAARLDAMLHKLHRPTWVRTDPVATAFCDDYVPMLARDREGIEHNWRLMKATGHRVEGAPVGRAGARLDGLELTLWMIADFEHLCSSSTQVDEPLRRFNLQRRKRIVLPDGWSS